MKITVLLFTVLLSISSALANYSQPNDSVFSIVEEMPEFKGGVKALNKYINENLHQPEAISKLGIRAKVYVKFVVNAHGKLEQIEVLRTSYRKPKNKKVADEDVEAVIPALELEAVRLIKKLPPWNPGKQKGKRVNVATIIPLTFIPKV